MAKPRSFHEDTVVIAIRVPRKVQKYWQDRAMKEFRSISLEIYKVLLADMEKDKEWTNMKK